MSTKHEYELGDCCPKCCICWFLFPPATIDEYFDGRFQPSNQVRCVECKEVFNIPEQRE